MRRLLVVAVVPAGCVQLPPSPQDIQAKKFESVPDKVYFVPQRLSPWMRWPQSYFYPVREDYGRAVVMRSQLIP